MRRVGTIELTFPQLFSLEAVGWDDDTGAPFDSPAAAREAWEANREALIARAIERRPGHRPFAFWVLDAKRPDLLGDADDWRTWPAAERRQRAWLREHGDDR